MFALLALTLAVLLPLAATAQRKVTRQVENRRIDWNKRTLYATGLGPISNREPNEAKAYVTARRVAIADARRNLLALIESVRIDSQTLVKDYELASDTIREQISGLIKGAEIFSERKVQMGNSAMVEVTVSLPMDGEAGLAGAVLPEVINRHAETQDVPANVEPIRPAAPPKVELPRRTQPTAPIPAPRDSEPVTSVIIDARGLGIERSMAPKLRREDGSEVWGTVRANPDFVLEHGIVVYATSLAEARRDSRAGANPLILRAIGRAGSRFRTDPVLSWQDVERLREANQGNNFLDNYRVIFVVDPGK
jgi:hypothetical protein